MTSSFRMRGWGFKRGGGGSLFAGHGARHPGTICGTMEGGHYKTAGIRAGRRRDTFSLRTPLRWRETGKDYPSEGGKAVANREPNRNEFHLLRGKRFSIGAVLAIRGEGSFRPSGGITVKGRFGLPLLHNV